MKAALVSGFWAQNIGNAYFNIGGKWILDQVFGSDNVQFIQDQPSYRTFYPQHKGAPRNYAKILNRVDVDYVFLQGPMLTSNFSKIWGETFKEYARRGVKVCLLGAAFFKYTEKEISDVKAFLKEFPVALISTRDAETYNHIKDSAPFTHNGIDSAFFVPKAFNPVPFVGDYVTFNFDRFPEPTISENSKAAQLQFEGRSFSLSTPKLQDYFSHKGKSQAYLGHLLDFRNLPNNFAGYEVIRPEHRYAPHMTHKIYQHSNSFVSDEPFTYFSVYAGTKLTLADRVHACVMTLAYGNPAMLFTPSPRQALFDRLGLGDIRKNPVTLDLNYLEDERKAVIKFLRETISTIESEATP